MSPIDAFQKSLQKGQKIVLSGACGTEIQRRGVETALPLWSAGALFTNPEVVKQIHRDYIDAGADIITTNTFRTNVRTFKDAGGEVKAREGVHIACTLAKEAREESGRTDVAIGGSVAPVEDCYRPDLVPPDGELESEHDKLVSWLTEEGVDFIFIETMNCVREARVVAKIAQGSGLPFMVSFVCASDGNLLSGESLKDAIQAIQPFGPVAFFTNCRPLPVIEASVDELLKDSPIAVGVYANGDGEPDDTVGWRFKGEHPEINYGEHAKVWLEKGVSVIGSCCGSTPTYTKMLKALVSSES